MKNLTNLLANIKEKAKKAKLKTGAGIVAGTTLIGTILPNFGCVTPAYFFTPSFLLTEADKDSIKRYREEYENPREKSLKERYEGGNENLFFTCKNWVDENNNNIAEFEEFRGITNYFKEYKNPYDTHLNIVVVRNESGLLKQLVLNPQGNYVRHPNGNKAVDYRKIPYSNNGWVSFFEAAICFDENDTPGIYTYQYFLNGKYIGKNKVIITR